jgi:hypothetical protein
MAYASGYGRIHRQKSRTQGGRTWLVAIVAFLAGIAAGVALAVPATLLLQPSGGPSPSPEIAARQPSGEPSKDPEIAAQREPQVARHTEPSGAPSQEPAAKERAPRPVADPPPTPTPPAAEEPAPAPPPPATEEPAPKPIAKPTPKSTLPAAEEPTPASTPPSQSGPADPLARPLLKKADFEYLGTFALPKRACGGSTNWCVAGLAFRKLDRKLRFICATGHPSGDLIYEASFPGFGKDWGNNGNKLPRARVVKEWGDIYRGREDTSSGDGGWRTYGLFWDEPTKRLYWSQAIYYNSTGRNTPSLGYTELTDKGPVSHGPWVTNSYIQKVRGGCLRLPDYFAKKYTKGHPLALGFGGAYCIIAGGSFGPCLYASTAPQKEGEILDTLALLNYEASPNKAMAYYCHRDTDYRSEIEWDKNPTGGVGFWNAADTVCGACCWIDLPDKHGLLVLGRMGHGRIWYGEAKGGGGDKGVHAERTEPWWYVFDPADLAAVAQGKKQPHAPIPKWWKCEETGEMTTGCCFDPETRTLYVLDANRWLENAEDVEPSPVVHGYRVKK